MNMLYSNRSKKKKEKVQIEAWKGHVGHGLTYI